MYLFFVLLCVFVARAVYSSFGHRLVEEMYYGRSIRALNVIIEGQAAHPLKEYYAIADLIFTLSVSMYVAAALFVYVCLIRRNEIRSFLSRHLSSGEMARCFTGFAGSVRRNTRIVALGFTVFIAFFCLYAVTASMFANTSAFIDQNILFGCDTQRAIGDIAVFDANHYRTNAHPLFVLFTNPAGTLLSSVAGSKVLAAILVNSFFGGLACGMAYVLFRLFSGGLIGSLLFTLLFGLTTSQFAFSVIPETISFTTASLVVLYILLLVSLRTGKVYFVMWVIAGIFALGARTVNFFQVLICFCFALTAVKDEEKADCSYLSMIVGYVSVVLISATSLAVIQKVIYRSSALFFAPWVYVSDVGYISWSVLSEPVAVVVRVVVNFFLVNIAAPFPTTSTVFGSLQPAVKFNDPWNYSYAGWLCVFFWICILAFSAVRCIFHGPRHRKFLYALLVCLIFNIIFHSFYGVREPFLFSGNVTLLLISLVCINISLRNLYDRALLACFVVVTGVNNFIVMERVLAVYK